MGGKSLLSDSERQRLEAAEEFCWHVLLMMHFGATADEILRDERNGLQTWANLAADQGHLREDDPKGVEVGHNVPYPDGPVLPGYER